MQNIHASLELTMIKNRKIKTKIFLSSIIIFSAGVILVIFISNHFTENDLPQQISSFRQKATLSIKNFRYSAYKEGKKAWTINANAAYQMEVEKEELYLLENISATYFKKEGNKVKLSGQQGTLAIETNNIEVAGDVVLKDEIFEIKTEKLQYEHNRNIIRSNEAVHITAEFLDFYAETISIDLHKNEAVLKENVEGNFSGEIFF